MRYAYNGRVQLPVGLVHPHVVASQLLLGPELELAVSSSSILVSSLVQGISEFTGPLKQLGSCWDYLPQSRWGSASHSLS